MSGHQSKCYAFGVELPYSARMYAYVRAKLCVHVSRCLRSCIFECMQACVCCKDIRKDAMHPGVTKTPGKNISDQKQIDPVPSPQR